MSSILSGWRGAKQLVVDKTQSISDPCNEISSSILDKLVVITPSPSITFSTTNGINPAVRIDLKHDFWSIRGQMIYFALGLVLFIVSMQSPRDIPVASGTIIDFTMKFAAHAERVQRLTDKLMMIPLPLVVLLQYPHFDLTEMNRINKMRHDNMKTNKNNYFNLFHEPSHNVSVILRPNIFDLRVHQLHSLKKNYCYPLQKVVR